MHVRDTRFAALCILGLPLLIAAAIFGPPAADVIIHRRAPDRYIVPAGFRGWVRIDLQQRSAPALPIEKGKRVFRLDPSGRLQTSDSPRTGHAKDEFFEERNGSLQPLLSAGMCKGGSIWGLETLTDDRTGVPYTRFFVGDEGEYRREIDPIGKNFPSC